MVKYFSHILYFIDILNVTIERSNYIFQKEHCVENITLSNSKLIYSLEEIKLRKLMNKFGYNISPNSFIIFVIFLHSTFF
jgi:hypothetical protein